MGALPESVFHYTRTATLLKVVQSKEFWLSNVFFMNDFLEINVAIHGGSGRREGKRCFLK